MYRDKKMFKKLSLLLTVLMTVMLLIPVAGANAAGGAGPPANSAVQFLYNDYTTSGINNSDAGVGSYALYVLTQAGVDADAWLHDGVSLKDAVISAVSADIANAAGASAKLLAQDLAAAKALGRNDLAGQIVQVLQNRQSSAGFDSNLYSDIPAYDLLGRAGSVSEINREYAKDCILGAQETTVSDAAYGSFGSAFDGTFYPDFMTTAEAVRALNYLDPAKGDAQIQTAINNGLNWMRQQQQAGGSFNVGGWDDPVVDTSEVILTFKTLGMDPFAWKSGGGKSAVDYIINNALNSDGSFGTSKNDMDATWALCAYNSLPPVNNAVQFLYNDYIANGINNSDDGVGSYALYVLTRAGVDGSTWVHDGVSLEDAVISAISGDIANAAAPAKLLAQDLAAAKALGRNDLAGQIVQVLQNRQSSAGFDSNLYSDIPAYELLGRAGLISVINEVYAKDCILGAQNTTVSDAAYGSFGGAFDGTFYPDFMTTAEAVRALNYLDPAESGAQIRTAINNGLNWMRQQQQADGSFKAGDWDDPVIDTSETVVTLKALGLDPSAWKSGSGKSAVEYLMNNALNVNGSFGTSENDMDATWALWAYTSLGVQCTTFWQYYLDPSSATLNVDDTEQFKAVCQDISGTTDVTQYVQWSVSDSDIAGVDSSGLVTALKAGQTVVNAVYKGFTASADLIVNSSSPPGNIGIKKTLRLAVLGINNELLYGPSTVTVAETNKWGLTALGALDASSIRYHTSSWSYGALIDSIGGQDNSGMSGWMYVVNGSSPTVGADKYNIKNNDKIIFYYSESMDQQPPKWNDLEKISPWSTGDQSANPPAPVSDTSLNTAIQNAGVAGRVVLQADSAETALALSNNQLTKILDTGKPLAVTIQGVEFVLSIDSLKIPEITAANAAQLQLKAKKLSSEDAQSLMEPFAVKLKLAGDVYELNVLVVDKDGTQKNIEQFPDCNVLLPVPGDLREAAAGGKIMAYRYNEDSKIWEEVGGTYDAAGGTIGFETNHFSKYALMEAVSLMTFKDISGHWAQKEIELMAAKGYVAGVGDNEFAPEVTITRAEFAAILVRMAGLTAAPGGSDRFSDVPAGVWYRGMVGAAAGAGLVGGMDENNFVPDEPVTREQMAAMMVRYMAGKGLDSTLSDTDAAELLAGFSDAADVSSWACTPVALMVREQIMNGRENSRFVPLGNTTRAEAAAVLCRVLQMAQSGE